MNWLRDFVVAFVTVESHTRADMQTVLLGCLVGLFVGATLTCTLAGGFCPNSSVVIKRAIVNAGFSL